MASSFNDESSLFNFVVKEGNGVKGLVDSGLTEVPRLYIQPPNQRIKSQQTATSPENMIIDLSELDGPNHDQVVKAIAHATETLGFFQVANHGVPLELLESLKAAAHQFFNQPTEKKAAYLKEVSPTPMVKYGTSFVPEKEKVLQWRDFVNMTYTNDADALEFWPNECKKVALEYIKTSKLMVKRLLQALIGNLGVKLDDSRIETLIVLLQDDIGGLYVKKSQRNDEWVEIPPIYGALVINVGDTLQILSNGRYNSAEHIVRTTSIASRVSIPIFNAPLPVAKIGPLPELVARDGVARYRELTYEEYMNNLFEKGRHEGKRALQFAYI